MSKKTRLHIPGGYYKPDTTIYRPDTKDLLILETFYLPFYTFVMIFKEHGFDILT
ncbi:hypothetical protein MYX76_12150 [Desulfobacterota bacterium AH_259_B03_O07]|nr:hypothetical protein [Desulfobacterota bacterium AH_259_B03_O07]